ncbi:MAG TPA: bifunctional folylpolyglutamate synthase/dihydrofolate synthase [Candidatus Blautia faecavium]|uniref:tetrahydrofolate synthase n=1 Tax=Candidatus Blautia faecavium TaxID=2838487 RepID=A0A9D2RWL6_9FIRM|nr:bifunctional folylpolyglutamate synthase/dihydrofolate synthase [Candidatus Blautia faecavium]
MDYQQSRTYIEDAKQYGSVLGLKNMQEMMQRLGNPQDKLSYVHVAGTNGKGSVIAYLYSVLSKAGYRIGRYISPAIYSYRERMETAGIPVSREKFAEYVTRVAYVIENMTKAGLPHPTPFEIETAVAFLFFAEEKCDLVLLEVGMGGNLDATNIVSCTLVAVLASISMDHQEFLGNTLQEIAEKKAGIIKPGCTVVSACQEEKVRETIRKAAKRAGARWREVKAEKLTVEKADIWGQRFLYEGEEYEISLSGEHQPGNAAVALKTLQCLDEKGFPTTLEQRKTGLKEAQWPGRFSVIHRSPLFIVDGAHNPGAAEMLAESVRRYFNGKKIFYIIGMFKDKDYNKVLEITCPYAQKIWTIQTPDNPRALPAGKLARAAARFHPCVEEAGSMEEAVKKAFHTAGKEDVILAFGSLSFLGELSRIVKTQEEK